MTDQELVAERDRLVRELQGLRASRKNLSNTIRNITDEMQAFYSQVHRDPIINPQEAPRA